jgi:hypothetical protein
MTGSGRPAGSTADRRMQWLTGPGAGGMRLQGDNADPCPTRWHQSPPAPLRRPGWSDRAGLRRGLPRDKPDDAAGLAARSGELSQRIPLHWAVQVDPIAGGPARPKRRGDRPSTGRGHPHQPDIDLSECLFDHTVFLATIKSVPVERRARTVTSRARCMASKRLDTRATRPCWKLAEACRRRTSCKRGLSCRKEGVSVLTACSMTANSPSHPPGSDWPKSRLAARRRVAEH